jgi:rubrerythrin
MEQPDWTHVLTPLLSLASKLEAEGQYNLAKLARAAVDALGRRAAYQHILSTGEPEPAEEIARITETLSGMGVEPDLLVAFRRGAAVLAEGRLPLINETPHPYVCRTCGHVVVGAVTEKCPPAPD